MIALDTSALIWAVRGDGAKQAVIDARMQAIQGMGPLIVPAPALAEYLCKVPAQDRAKVVADVASFATVVPFDYPSAIAAAGLLTKPRAKGTKQTFKVDAMILAVAIANRATTLIVKDQDFHAYPSGSVCILDVSHLRIQSTLPLNNPL